MAKADTTQSSPLVRTEVKPEWWHLLELIAFTLIGAFLASHYYRSDVVTTTGSAGAESMDMSKVKILSFDPFVAHITDFISQEEITQLLDIG